jgi:hypothetical protein
MRLFAVILAIAVVATEVVCQEDPLEGSEWVTGIMRHCGIPETGSYEVTPEIRECENVATVAVRALRENAHIPDQVSKEWREEARKYCLDYSDPDDFSERLDCEIEHLYRRYESKRTTSTVIEMSASKEELWDAAILFVMQRNTGIGDPLVLQNFEGGVLVAEFSTIRNRMVMVWLR